MLRGLRSNLMITTTVRHASEAHRIQTAALRDDAIMPQSPVRCLPRPQDPLLD